MHVIHTLDPVYDSESIVLILGSIPSIKSRENGFYYAHPKNRFWSTLSKVFNEEIKNTKEDKINFLLKHHIALFDSIKECDIKSSSDSSIKNVIPNDITNILNNSKIKYIFTTGRKSYNIYQKYIYPNTNIKAIYLPSPSPANTPKDIDLIGVNIGPGSFTGIRASLTVAKVMAQELNIKIVPVESGHFALENCCAV